LNRKNKQRVEKKEILRNKTTKKFQKL